MENYEELRKNAKAYRDKWKQLKEKKDNAGISKLIKANK